ncbi:hypothetical protein QFC22_004573 [Naganishia vaughanmartiniae]|uniref:Uncharacterized protein n=1 Tax=Naganishia vaughanmartiniae TaxID=1424756 RepID=A0ACC2WZV4_9TREE|nr:hypothetical protein QFC22_004573 [Naganishia vaughanmartiniae]
MTESPKSARTAFKPISKMASRSILRDRQPPNTPSSDDHSTRPLHMVTPSKNAFQSLFGKIDRATSSTPPPPVPSIPAQHRMSTNSSSGGSVPVTPFRASRAHTEHGTIIQPSNEATPVAPKIRAGMTPEARTRLMPTPKPLPPSKLRGNQTPSSSSTAGSTMRLVQPRQSISRSQEPFTRDSYDLPMQPGGSMREPLGGSHDEWDTETHQRDMAVAETGWQEIGSQSSNETVLVTVRIRPLASMNPHDANAWSTPVDAGHPLPRTIRLADGTRKEWCFDQILPPATTNHQTYLSSALPHVRSAMQGFNAVCFAYGQTGSGKSHTMAGTVGDPGVVPLAVDEIFRIIREGRDREWVLRASYLELYNEMLVDLLTPPGPGGTTTGGEIQILNGKKEGEVQINGLTEMIVTNVAEVKKVLSIGDGRRRTGCTDWNERSSRSHSVFRIVIESRSKSNTLEDEMNTRNRGKNQATRISTLSLIDLAGSEKATASKERNAEGRYINQSLLTLKNVISKLAEQSAKKTTGHIPYRDSKLTRLLQPSLSGDAKISVICTINPSQSAIAESQSTLAFAAGIKRVVLHAKQTEVVDPAALIQQYQTEIADLRAKLAEKDAEMSQASQDGYKRMTLKERQEQENQRSRLDELRRLILTSNNVDDEETTEENAKTRPLSPTKVRIQYEASSFSLQEELCVAQAKVKEQALEIAELKKQLELRPQKPDEEVARLKLEVDQLNEIIKDYENNMDEPSVKLREDVEAEWLPKVQKLEARAKERETFYKSLYNSVLELKSQKAQLKERCQKLESICHEYIALHEPSQSEFDYRSNRGMSTSSTVSSPVASTVSTFSSNQDDSHLSGNPYASRVTSVSMAHLGSKLAMSNVGRNGGGLRSLKEDSSFDLAKQVALVESDEEIF